MVPVYARDTRQSSVWRDHSGRLWTKDSIAHCPPHLSQSPRSHISSVRFVRHAYPSSLLLLFEMDPSYPAFPIAALIGLILVLIPFPWHLQAWNSGTCLFMFWSALISLNLFVNSIVWHGNALNPAPIWCDICASLSSESCVLSCSLPSLASRIIIAGTVALPAASLCINRRLYQIASVRTVSLTRADVRSSSTMTFPSILIL